ncbi:minor capsid protein [Streptomyces sp. NBC_01571]|uniref:minor capsid protein n=1 Tax=Streptomyces sp. NBC_01571 TaxID=2975883 RepID=UPI00224DFA56|nr:minor capsid protein [Streptomyces sp. NBC_01571]MCX4575606.1 minor capsid protein [Streptomyces sp. NBC_01571]
MSGYTSSLLDGIAGLLAEAGVGVFTPDAVVQDPDTGIFRGVMPDSPERALGITAYPVTDDDTTNAITAVQIRMRAGRDPDAIDNLADVVFDELHNRRQYRIGGIFVALSWRQSQAWIGQDAQKRMELTSNYYFRTTRSGAHLID